MDHTDSARAELSRGIVDATDAIAQAARTHRCHLVHISSCAVYETGQAPFAETDSLHPSSPYGQLKLDAEAALRSHQRHGLRATVLRPFRTYGPGCTEGLIAEACEAALESAPLRLTQGSQVREWNHVDAIAAGIIWAVGARPVGDVLNLGGGPRSSVFEIARRVYALANADADLIQRGARPARPGAIPRFWGDLRRLESRRGPLPHTALQTGLRQTLEWHRAQRSVAR
jgi:UDP-glucose 4-epimerase